MVCPICKGNMEENMVNFPIDLKTRFILVKEVPALVCEQCGEFFIDDEIQIRIEKIITPFSDL